MAGATDYLRRAEELIGGTAVLLLGTEDAQN
jgi:hypothetical protein